MTNIVTIPDSLPYPKIEPFEKVRELNNKFVYVFKKYNMSEGIGILIKREHEMVCIRLSDFAGNVIQPTGNGVTQSIVDEVMNKHSARLSITMRLMGIDHALFYFSNDNGVTRLVDIRFHGKFCGPGALQDFFGRQGIPIQERVGDPLILNEENLRMIFSASGDYPIGEYIVKPSAFKFMVRNDEMVPLYGVISNAPKHAS